MESNGSASGEDEISPRGPLVHGEGHAEPTDAELAVLEREQDDLVRETAETELAFKELKLEHEKQRAELDHIRSTMGSQLADNRARADMFDELETLKLAIESRSADGAAGPAASGRPQVDVSRLAHDWDAAYGDEKYEDDTAKLDAELDAEMESIKRQLQAAATQRAALEAQRAALTAELEAFKAEAGE